MLRKGKKNGGVVKLLRGGSRERNGERKGAENSEGERLKHTERRTEEERVERETGQECLCHISCRKIEKEGLGKGDRRKESSGREICKGRERERNGRKEREMRKRNIKNERREEKGRGRNMRKRDEGTSFCVVVFHVGKEGLGKGERRRVSSGRGGDVERGRKRYGRKERRERMRKRNRENGRIEGKGGGRKMRKRDEGTSF